MSQYADLFLIPVPDKTIEGYRALAELSRTIWLEHGALAYAEFEADDVKPGKWTSFPQSVDLKDGERVVAAIITHGSRAQRDAVNAKAMADPRMAGLKPETLPFDGKRMIFGGFKPFVGDLAAPNTGGIQPYLFFRGRCDEAIAYYQEKLGAEVLVKMRFKDNPDQPSPDAVPTELAERIMHASLRIKGSDIMMSDGMKSGPLDFNCMSLSLPVATEAEADQLFGALAADGMVQMPMGPTFFARRFGAVADKFGVAWMIIVPQPMPG